MAGIALRCFASIFPLPARQGGRVIQQDRINVGAVIEFARALFAQRDGEEPGKLRIGQSPRYRRAHGGIKCIISKIAQLAHHSLQRKRACQIAHAQSEREDIALEPQRGGNIRNIAA